jgi:integrase
MSRSSTGHIRKLSSGRYQARFTFPDGLRRPAPTTFQTKRDANAWLAQQNADVSRGQWSPNTKATVNITFAAYSKRWLTLRRVKGQPLADRTRSGYQDLLDRFILPTFGHHLVHSITRDLVDSWYERTAKGAPTYRARAYGLLRTILNSAVDDGFFTISPAKIRGAGYAPRRHQVEPATLEELALITEAMPPRYRLLVQLAAWCALRHRHQGRSDQGASCRGPHRRSLRGEAAKIRCRGTGREHPAAPAATGPGAPADAHSARRGRAAVPIPE